jgi:hypothetical protein
VLLGPVRGMCIIRSLFKLVPVDIIIHFMSITVVLAWRITTIQTTSQYNGNISNTSGFQSTGFIGNFVVLPLHPLGL